MRSLLRREYLSRFASLLRRRYCTSVYMRRSTNTAFKERAKIFELMGKSDKAKADLSAAPKLVE